MSVLRINPVGRAAAAQDPAARRCLAQDNSGFSLVIVSILITVAAILMVSMLPGNEAGDYNAKSISNVQKLERVEAAMRAFMAFNGRRPCPADGRYAVTDQNFGVEATTPGICTTGTLKAPMGPDNGTNEIVAGTIPARSLGLPDDYAFDQYGRRFTYVVDKRATSHSSCLTLEGITDSNSTPTLTGGLVIKDSKGGSTIDDTMYAYISHGPSGYGAFPAEGSSVANRINSGSNDADMQNNAGVDNGFNYNPTNFTNVLVKKDRVLPTSADTGFDDLVWYRDDIKNTCCLGPKCTIPGFIVNGYSNERSATSVAMGDVNGDGIPDLIIGAPYITSHGLVMNGSIYVVFGTKSGFPDPLPLNTLNGSNGFVLYGVANAKVGYSVAVGNVNGDNYGDIIIGAPYASPTGAQSGAVYVVFGQQCGGSYTACTSAAELSSSPGILDGTHGAEFDGASSNNLVGWSVAAADINNDTITDLIIGGPNTAPGGRASAGSVYVVFGKNAGWSGTATTLDYNFLNGTSSSGVEFDGVGANDYAGYSVAAGKINNGNPGMVIGAPLATPGGRVSAGSAYAIFGQSPLLPQPTVSTFTGSGSTTITPSAYSGLMVGQTLYVSPGIVNGQYIKTCNGSSSLGAVCTSGALTLSSATTVDINAGTIMYVVSTPLVSALFNGTNGIEYDGTGGNGLYTGFFVTTGDINGSGIPGVILGAPISAPGGRASAGSIYAIFGQSPPLPQPTVSTFTSTGSTTITPSAYSGLMVGQALYVSPGIVSGQYIKTCNGSSSLGAVCTSGVLTLSSATTVDINAGTIMHVTSTPLTSTFINGSNGVEFDGAVANDQLGWALATGDVNDDGIPDLIIGTPMDSPGGLSNAGSAYVIFGKKTGWSGTATTLNSSFLNGINGSEFDGAAANDQTGFSVAAGDLNGNGIDDVIIGAHYALSQSGSTYIFFGKKKNWPTSPYALGGL